MSSSYGFYKTTGKILGPTSNLISLSSKSFQKFENEDAFFSVKVKRSEYRCISGAKKKYQVYLNKDNFHWYIILHHEEEGTTYPFLTVEITADDSAKIYPVMRELQLDRINTEWKIIEIEIILDNLCETADEIVSEMGKYNLFTKDCQTFCNHLLLGLKLIDKPFPTSFGPDLCQSIK